MRREAASRPRFPLEDEDGAAGPGSLEGEREAADPASDDDDIEDIVTLHQPRGSHGRPRRATGTGPRQRIDAMTPPGGDGPATATTEAPYFAL